MSLPPPELDNPLAREPIPRLVRRIAVPVSTGMFFQTMYNVVDTWAAGRLSTESLAALTASFPVFFLIISVAHASNISSNALISFELGRNDEERARELAGQSLFFATWLSLTVGLLGWLTAPRLLDLMGITGETLSLAIQYVRTIFLATPCFVLGATFNGMLSARGDTRPFRNSLILGFLLNIVFDLWFVFGGLGLPAMGFAGIARATVLLKTLTAIYMWSHAVRAKLIPPTGFAHLHPRWHTQRRLMGQGFPAMFNMLTIGAGIFVQTWFAGQIGTKVLAAFGTGMRIEQIALLPILGLNTAAMTLAGHSYGAGRPDRLKSTMTTCLRLGTTLYLIGAPPVGIFAPFWMRQFSTDPEVISIGVSFLRISLITFYAMVLLFILTSILQGLQRPMFVIWLGVVRKLIFPLLLIPPLMARIDPPELGIWIGMLISAWIGVLIAIVFMFHTWRHVKAEIHALSKKNQKNRGNFPAPGV